MWLCVCREEELGGDDLEDVPYTAEDVPDFGRRRDQMHALDTSLLAGEEGAETMDQLIMQEEQVYNRDTEVSQCRLSGSTKAPLLELLIVE